MIKSSSNIKLSVIVPSYNEQKTIGKIIARLSQTEGIFEIIVVDDGSADQTAQVIQRIKNNKVRFTRHARNQGKGAAIRTGLSLARGNYVLIQDADLEYDPRDIPKLLDPVVRGQAEIVYGSRFLTLGNRSPSILNRLANWWLTLVTNLLYGAKLSDMETCYKLLPTKLLRTLNLGAQGFDFEPEVTAKILRKGLSIHEVPISYFGREYWQGKKIGPKDGVIALWILLKYRISAF